jgi:hypothetical protein
MAGAPHCCPRIHGARERAQWGGFDNGTTLDMDASNPEKLVFQTSFHHMDENGCYSGWTSHRVVVVPSLAFGIRLHIGGEDRNDIKSYIFESFTEFLTGEGL